MNGCFIGINIQLDTVSAVRVKSGFRESRIEGFGQAVLSDSDPEGDGLISAIQQAVSGMDLKGATCIAAIPSHYVSFRNIQAPFKDKKKIRQILPFEIEPLLPYPVEDLVADFYPFRLNPSDGKTDLFVAAIKKSTVKTYLGALSSAGIEPDMITLGGYATARLLCQQTDHLSQLLFINRETKGITLFAASAGQLFFARFLPENMLATHPVGHIGSSIKRTLAAFPDMFGIEFRPEEAFISDRTEDGLPFTKEMERQLGIPVKPFNLFQHIDIINNNQNKILPSHGFNSAASLAVAPMLHHLEINFLQGDFSPTKARATYKHNMIRTTVFAGLALIAFFLNIFTDTYYKEKKLARINGQVLEIFQSTFPDVKRIEAPLNQMKLKIRETQNSTILPGHEGKDMLAIDILYQLSRLISGKIDINLTRLVIGEGSVVLSGDTDTFNAVDHIKSKLEQSKSFDQVTINSADMEKGTQRVRFKMKIQLKS